MGEIRWQLPSEIHKLLKVEAAQKEAGVEDTGIAILKDYFDKKREKKIKLLEGLR